MTSTDSWFRPVDVAHASDGSLYIADWYDPGVGGHGYRDKIIGRVSLSGACRALYSSSISLSAVRSGACSAWAGSGGVNAVSCPAVAW